eukprot:11420532-Alexandrium_andersonii.AAC.1
MRLTLLRRSGGGPPTADPSAPVPGNASIERVASLSEYEEKVGAGIGGARSGYAFMVVNLSASVSDRELQCTSEDKRPCAIAEAGCSAANRRGATAPCLYTP